jgi:hypothetical protein
MEDTRNARATILMERAGSDFGKRVVMMERLAAEEKEAREREEEEAGEVAAAAGKRWREEGLLPDGWQGFAQELGNIGAADAFKAQQEAMMSI